MSDCDVSKMANRPTMEEYYCDKRKPTDAYKQGVMDRERELNKSNPYNEGTQAYKDYQLGYRCGA